MVAVTREDSHRSRSKTTAESVRRVFIARQDSYAPAEGAAVLGWTLSQIEPAIEEGAVEVTRRRSGVRIAWRELAALLTAQHPQAEIEEALGPAMTSVIPEPVRLADLTVRIPRYQVAMLAKLAERERISVDELMARHLLDLATAEAGWLGRCIPGFDAAMRWPAE